MIRSALAMLLGIFTVPAVAEPACFDLAVIATSPSYKWLPIVPPPEPGEIILHSPVQVSFAVEKVLLGSFSPNRIRVIIPLHNRYNRDIRHFLLLLKRQPNGQFHLIDMNVHVVQLANGGYAMPLTGPLDEELLQPEGYISADYEKRITPLHYAASEAWWLEDNRISPDIRKDLAENFPWAVINQNRLIAPRGLEIRALTDMMRPLRCPRN